MSRFVTPDVEVRDGSSRSSDDLNAEIARLRAESHLLRDIIEHLPTSVQLKSVTNDYRIVMWNRAAEDMYGLPREHAIGRTVHDLWPAADADRMHASDLGLVASGEGVEFPDRPAQTRDRGPIRVHMRKVPLLDQDGRVSHLLVIADDVSERLAAADALGLMQARYQRALDGSSDAIWELDLQTRRLFHSDRLQGMLGLPLDRHFGRPARILRLARPDQRRSLWRAFVAALEGSPLHWEGELVRANGRPNRYRLRGTLTRDAAGRPLLAAGTIADIENEKRVEEELRRHRDDLAGLVAERTAELQAATRAAEAANLAKSEFLANISHELRTPMHAIVSFANFGVDKFDTVGRKRLHGYFERIRDSADRLLALLNDLLDLSRMEAGRMETHLAATDLKDLLDTARREVEALAQSRGIGLELHMPEGGGSIRVCWDFARMLQVMRNLLSNAAKFSPPGATIRIEVEPAAGTEGTHPPAVNIRVRDQGIGIPEEELEAVFDKFVQSSRTKSGAGGTGLGLAITREILSLHGGTIRAANNPPPSTGAVFTITLPLDAGRATRAGIGSPSALQKSVEVPL